MRTADFIRLSTGTLFSHRMRSMLTMLGIVVGIGAVVLLTAIGEGVRQYVLTEFTQFGTNLVAVVPGKTTTFGISGASISTVRPLSLDDAEALKKLANIRSVVPVVQGNASVEFGSRQRRTMVLGVGSKVPEVWQMPVATGRFLPDDNVRSSRSYAVLGDKMRAELFGTSNALGQRIRVGGERYRVIGVMEAKGQMLGFDLDDTIYLPVDKTMEMFDREGVMEIDLLYEANSGSESITKNIQRLLIARHGSEDFTVITQDSMLEVLDSILEILTMGVAAIGGISLLVGSVGIITIMTITVAERTSEIGLLRAIGARRINILTLFVGEAILLSVLGGILGITLAVISVILIQFFVPGLPVEIAWYYVALALVLAIVIGILAGIAPAMRAASLNPLEALRTE